MRNPFVKLLLAAIAIALMVYQESVWWLLLYVIPYGLHLVFRDTMNRFQWFPFWGSFKRRMYWIARNNESMMTPMLSIGHVYHDFDTPEGERYFHGTGIMVSIRHWSFQVGVGKLLERRLWGRDIDVEVEEIRKGVDGVWIEGDPVASDLDQ